MLFPPLHKQIQSYPTPLLWQRADNGVLDPVQIYTTTDSNPNTAGIVPTNPAIAAEFYQDPSITLYNVWRWSITNQTWIQVEAP